MEAKYNNIVDTFDVSLYNSILQNSDMTELTSTFLTDYIAK